MEVLHLFLVMLVCILVSALLEQAIPRVSLPLVQIALGVVVSLVAGVTWEMTLDPSLFMVLLVAPLLFDESRHVKPATIWHHRGAISSLAVGLVLATMLTTGITLHLLLPTVSLAAAFALGAALSPTDATAVLALSKDISLNPRQDTLLNTEALLNDASGVVSFQFALAAAVTGTFSVVEAGGSFLWQCLGGIAVGLIVALLGTLALRVIRSLDTQTISLHLVFEVLMPFVTYLAATAISASGILAVVAAGLCAQLTPRRRTPEATRLAIASASVWGFISFVINGIIFTLLGMQLPLALTPSWRSNAISNPKLIAVAAAVCACVVLTRFVWVGAMELLRRRHKPNVRRSLKDALIMTLAGPKGAITLSIVFTLPYTIASGAAFSHRSTMIFIACATIVATLVAATFIVPLLAPAASSHDDEALTRARMAILEKVCAHLRAEKPADTARQAAQTLAIQTYQDRLSRLRAEFVTPNLVGTLKLSTLARQRRYIAQRVEEGTISREAARSYDARLREIEHMIGRLTHIRLGAPAVRTYRNLQRPVTALRSLLLEVRSQLSDEALEEELHALAVKTEQVAIDHLRALACTSDEEEHEAALLLMADHAAVLATLELTGASTLPVASASAATRPFVAVDALEVEDPTTGERIENQRIRQALLELHREALQLELDTIQAYEDDELLTKAEAAELSDEVHLMQLGLGSLASAH